MMSARIRRYRLTPFVLAGLLAGCGAPSLAPGGPTVAAPAAEHRAASEKNSKSWITAGASARDLLYVTRPYAPDVDLYTYPSGRFVGQLTGLSYPIGDCTDKKANVYITDFTANAIVEYAHGGTKPIRTLPVPAYGPVACAVDPASGDLAVTSAGNASGGGANVAIFRKAKGMPTTYTDAKIAGYASCAYDGAGNLFVDGAPARGYGYDYELAELPRGAASLQGVTVQYGIAWSAPLQRDGNYLAIGQPVNPQIQRYSISGGYATYVSSTPLSDAYDAFAFIIAGKKAIVANLYFYDIYIYKWDVLVYDYPKGGFSTEDIMNTGSGVGGVTLSRRRK